MKSSVIYLLVLVAVVAGDNFLGEIKKGFDVLNQGKAQLEKEHKVVQQGLKEAEEKTRLAFKSLVSAGWSGSGILEEVEQMPPECRDMGREALRQQWPDFFHCPNLTYFHKDVDTLVIGGFNMTRSLLEVAVDFFHGYSLCTGWNPFKWIPCYVENTYHLVGHVRQSMTLVNNYFTNFVTVVHNMTASYEYCRSNSPSIFTLTETLDPAYQCYKNTKNRQ